MAETRCPRCGRKLLPVNPNAPMTCDGCSHAFDPARVRRRAAPLPKRLLGWSLILLAVLTAIRSVPQAKSALDREGGVSYVVGLYLVPFLVLVAGLALSRSRLIEEPAPAGDQASASPTA